MYLCIVVKILSPSICLTIWMVPIIFFSTVITKEGVKSSPCGSVVCFEETKMPLEKN